MGHPSQRRKTGRQTQQIKNVFSGPRHLWYGPRNHTYDRTTLRATGRRQHMPRTPGRRRLGHSATYLRASITGPKTSSGALQCTRGSFSCPVHARPAQFYATRPVQFSPNGQRNAEEYPTSERRQTRQFGNAPRSPPDPETHRFGNAERADLETSPTPRLSDTTPTALRSSGEPRPPAQALSD